MSYEDQAQAIARQRGSRMMARAAANFPHHALTESREQVVNLRLKWLNAVKYLGDRWLLAKPISRKECKNV